MITVSAMIGKTPLNGDIKIAKNLTVSNDLITDGKGMVGGKLTAKRSMSINGYVIQNGNSYFTV